MTAKKRPTAKGLPADEADVRLWLIEHGGAPYMTTVAKDGSTATSPVFPKSLPTLAAAMKKYPCTDAHGDRKPAICCVARRLTKKGAKRTENGVSGTCGRAIPITLPGLDRPHVGCPICRPYPAGYDVQAEDAKAREAAMPNGGTVVGGRDFMRDLRRRSKKRAKRKGA